MSTITAVEIADKYIPCTISRNEYLLKEGTVCNESHFIEEGMMRAYSYDLEGNDITTRLLCKRNPHQRSAVLFYKKAFKENIQALTDCQTWYMTYEDMQASFHSIPEYREFGRQNIINHYSQLKERMLSMLQQTAEQRYAGLLHSNPGILQQAPLKYIATYLGITDTSLSRIRKEFIKR